MSPNAAARASALLIPAVIGAGLLLTSTMTFSEAAWKFDIKRMLELAFLPPLFGLVLVQPALRQACSGQLRRTPRWLAIILLGVLVLGIASAVRNAAGLLSLLYSLADVALLALLVVGLYAIAASRAVAGPGFDRVAMLLLALVGVAVGLQELVGVMAALSSGLEFHPRIALMHFSWPRFYNQVQAWSIPVVAALPLVFPGRPLARVLAIAALALNWYVLIATGARGSTLSVVVAVPLMLALLPAGRRHLAVNHVAGLAAGALLYSVVVWAHAQLPEPDAATMPVASTPATTAIEKEREASGGFMAPLALERMKTSSGRVGLWRATLVEAAKRPWLGNGPMNFACRGPTYREGHPHNFPLQMLHEWGVPATLLVLAAAVLLACRAIPTLRALQRDDTSNAAVAAAAGTGVLAAALLALVDGVLVMPASQATGLLVGGWFLGLTVGNGVRCLPQEKICSDSFSAGWVTHAILAGALVASLALFAFARHEFALAAERLEQTEVMDRLIPRFWQNGKVCKLYQEPRAT